MKYKNKQFIIDAMKWQGNNNKEEYPKWILDAIKSGELCVENQGNENVGMIIKIFEQNMKVEKNDYIVKGKFGELFRMSQEAFEENYERAE